MNDTAGWNALTPEELEAKVRAEHGDAVWEVVKRSLDARGDVKGGHRPERAKRVGKRAKAGPAIPMSKGDPNAKPMQIGHFRGWSGAPSPKAWRRIQRKKGS